MKLLNSIVEHQNSLLQLYLKLEQRFEENSVIRALWRDTADDVSLQIRTLQSLPPSFWNQFKNVPDDGFELIVKNAPSPPVDVADISLRDGFEISLRLAEPVVLKIYARVIRLLRKNSTLPALDFYIMVKTYVTRMARTTGSFAGDPKLTNRAQLLVAGLDKEARESVPATRTPSTPQPKKSTSPPKTAVSSKTAKEKTKKQPENIKPASPKSAKSAKSATLAESETLSGKTSTAARRVRR